jgi:hypothetical protein
MTVQCKALGKRSKLGQHTKSFPREWSEFQNWCDYMEVPDLAARRLHEDLHPNRMRRGGHAHRWTGEVV